MRGKNALAPIRRSPGGVVAQRYGRRTCDQEVAGSIYGRAAAVYDDSGQVIHTQLPRRRHSPLVYYRVVKLLRLSLPVGLAYARRLVSRLP